MFASKNRFLTNAVAGGGYAINNSLRFRASATAYLNRTFVAPTSSTIYTWSGWVKRGALSSTAYLFGASTTTNFGFNSSNNIVLTLAGTAAVTTSGVYRDPSAWYHVVYTQNGAAQTIYVNGVSAGTGTTSNTVFNTAISHQISAANTTNYFDGYLAEINFIDGQALTPSSFGAIDANGVWSPTAYSGSYGNNGFYLKFADNSGATATTIGKDSSGNGNNWTPNNISLASASYTSYTSGSGNYTVPAGVTSINYLVVAGGGGGAGSYGGSVANGGGGGGAGGVLAGTLAVTPGQTIAYSVGAGGTGSADGSTAATSGGNSTFSSFTATGGGRGGNGSNAASSGGSGGGGAADSPNQTGASGTSGQGTSGGNGTTSGAARAGGGGGATTAGATGLASGNGGAGYTWINGTTYGGGGGGGAWSSQSGGAGTGGSGGGGAGGTSGNGTAGTANTGGGGGGGGAPAGSSAATAGGNGGSGIVIIGVGASTTYDSMIDSPTNAASGTQPVGNYCVLNPIDKAAAASWTNGNLSYSQPTGVGGVKGTFGVSSGKWYWEVIPTANGQIIGMCPITVAGQTADFTTAQGAYGYYWTNGNKYVNGVSSAYGASYAINDVIGVALDLTALTITFYKNNVSQGAITGVPAGTYCAGITNASGITTTGNINFGQQPFTYTPPSGYQALCTANLTTPTIKNGAQYMAATTYTGTGATLSITNTVNSTSFKPDLVWTKSRSAIAVNKLTDSVRGVTNAFISNSTAAQTTDVNGVTAFNSNGFTVGTDTNYNTNAATYIGWQWLCNAGTTSSNTNGSITSTVQVNTTAGFSILTYTGTGANATVGHGLGIAPSAILIKRYSAATGPFNFWHTSLPTPTTQLLTINTSSSIFTNAAYWNSTLPSSTVFSVGTTTNNNASAGIYLAYCFAAITGYSAFGSYVGNASTDGPFVYCGFRPRYVLVTLADVTNADNTYVIDTSRNPYNVAQNLLVTDSSAAESTVVCIDILSNGFKCKSATVVNTTGFRYLYMAFAENPFNYSRAR